MTAFPDWAGPLLRCPHCGGALAGVSALASPVLGCEQGHRFDVARQGYVSLLGAHSRTDTGDSAGMVAARAAFLGGGWYARVAATVAESAQPAPPGPVVEVGAGTGYYLAAACAGVAGICPAARQGLAIDASRYALRRAARRAGVAAVLADAWSPLPVRNGVAAVVLSVFAPRNPAELARVTAPGGRVVVVTPEPDHLAELRGPVALLQVEPGKAARAAASFAGTPMTSLAAVPVRYRIALPRAAVQDLVAMGPTARHVAPDAVSLAVSRIPEPVQVTVSVTVTTLERTTGR